MSKFLLIALAIAGAILAAFAYTQVFMEDVVGPAAIFGLALLGLLVVVLFTSYRLSRTRLAPLVANAWLAVAAVMVTYIVVDLTAGYFLIKPLSPPIVNDQFRHHKLVPNSEVRFRHREFSYVQRVNSLGLRGRNRSASKPPGTIRVLMLGDSFTMGKGVPDDQTFAALIEASQGRKSAACNGKAVEALNAGVDSYSPILSFIHFKRELAQLHSDVVILDLDMSDLVQEDVYRRAAQLLATGELVAVP